MGDASVGEVTGMVLVSQSNEKEVLGLSDLGPIATPVVNRKPLVPYTDLISADNLLSKPGYCGRSPLAGNDYESAQVRRELPSDNGGRPGTETSLRRDES